MTKAGTKSSALPKAVIIIDDETDPMAEVTTIAPGRAGIRTLEVARRYRLRFGTDEEQDVRDWLTQNLGECYTHWYLALIHQRNNDTYYILEVSKDVNDEAVSMLTLRYT